MNKRTDVQRECYISVSKAAEIIGVNPQTIRHWTNDGIIKCFKTPGGHRRIPTSEIDRIIEEGMQGDDTDA